LIYSSNIATASSSMKKHLDDHVKRSAFKKNSEYTNRDLAETYGAVD